MTLPPTRPHALLRWFNTLKFQIVAIAIVAGVLSAVGTARLVLATTEADLERILLGNAAADGERTASLLANKLEMLQLALSAVARRVPPELWNDPQRMTGFLLDKPAFGALFNSILAARPGGRVLSRLEKGEVRTELLDLADREYFQRALKTDQPVVSEPLRGKVSGTPIVVLAVGVFGVDGTPLGVVAGSIALESTGLFANLGSTNASGQSRTFVIDRSGAILSHPDPAKVMQLASAEPGFAEVFDRWHGSGSPIDTRGSAVLSLGHLVSMAGIPSSDWTIVEVTPQAVALEPMANARRTAWQSAGGVGLLAGALAGLFAWFMTRPITQLRERATGLLAEGDAAAIVWPRQRGEVGELALAFQQVVEQRRQRQGETRALLLRLEAVLDHADVGIALSRDGKFELVSRQFCRLVGLEKAQAEGQPTRIIYPSDAAYQSLSERALPAFMAHGAFEGEVELRRSSGQHFWAYMRGRAVVRGDRSQGTIWLIDDVTETRKQRERLAWDSTHDSLTGLANRAAFEELLERATASAAHEPFCALFIDLDRFKLVNDTGGHAAGDAMLRNVARQLTSQLRQSDTVARLGGDEFAVLLNRCPAPMAHTIAEKLRRAVVGFQLDWEGETYGVGASIGLVEVDGSYPDCAAVLKAADAACYEAKRLGRDRVTAHVRKPGGPASVRGGLRVVGAEV